MKSILEKGVFYAALAILVAIASLAFVYVSVVMLAGIVGNLAGMSLAALTLLGIQISLGQALAIGTLLAVFIYLGVQFFPEKTDKFFDKFGMICAFGMLGSAALVFLGGFSLLILNEIFGLDVPRWSGIPLGMMMALLIYWWTFRRAE